MAKISRPPRKLTDDVVQLVAARMVENGGNAKQAMVDILPEFQSSTSHLTNTAWKLRKHPIVMAAMEEQKRRTALALSRALDRYEMTQERAAEELARLAFTELRQVADWATETDKKTGVRRQVLRFRDAAQIDPDAHRALTKVTSRADGSVVIEIADKRAAIMDLARLKGWIADKPADNTAAVSLIIQR